MWRRGRVICCLWASAVSLAFVSTGGCNSQGGQAAEPAEPDWTMHRDRMVSQQIEARGVKDPLVLESMRTVPRHLFVSDNYREAAYQDSQLPIGESQTISQPYIVALMSELLEVREGAKVLEIGTGSGYQAAVLAAMGCKVYSVEIIPELADQAEAVLTELGYDVTIMIGDGYHGWEQHAPYQGIIVTAAPDIPPQALLDQLDIGASLVIPVGPAGGLQTLWRFARLPTGDIARTRLAGVRFVPFTRDPGTRR